jgi:hypothetical protein
MSVAANEPIEGQGSEPIETQGQQQDAGTSLNPAWNDLMQVIPSQLHSLVTPHLQQWDKNYQEGIGKVHSEYEPWKPLLEQGVTPEQASYGLQLLEAISERPQEVFESLKNFLQIEDEDGSLQPPQEVGQEQGQQSTPIDISQSPEFQQMKQLVEAMAELTVQQNSQQLESQADSELEQEFASARQQHGDFDEKWVMVQMLANDKLSLEDAINEYKQFVQGILTNANRPGPRVLPGGGNTPSMSADPSKLEPKDRRNLVAEMLQAAAQQNG